MNREIKFKVWHKELKEMFWFDLMWGRSGRSGSGWLDVVKWGQEKKYSQVAFGTDNRVDIDPTECELMQFTGWVDKNGKDIYQGDLISENGSSPYEVIWQFHAGKWIMQSFEEGRYYREMAYDYAQRDYEVIGNVYETPQLLNRLVTAQVSDTTKV